jgi:GAF domain-containing protein
MSRGDVPDLGAIEQLQQAFLDSPTVDAFFEEIVRRAVGGVGPFASSCGLTLDRAGQVVAVASSDPLAQRANEVQFRQQAGPSLEAIRQDHEVVVTDLAVDERWPSYQQQALEAGVRASLSMPVRVLGMSSGALNVYAPSPRRFSVGERTRVLRYAAEISGVVSIALRFAEQAKVTEHLHAALSSRTTIDQAIGVIMAQNRCDADAAFTILRMASQNRNQKLRDVAKRVIETVTGHEPGRAPSFS